MKRIALILALLLLSCCLFSCNKVDKDDPNAKMTDLWDVPYQYDLSKYIDISKEDYVGITYTAKDVEVTDEEIQYEIEKLLRDNAEYIDEAGRVAEVGDFVNIDFQGYLDGVAFEGGVAEGEEFIIGEGGYIEGFEEGVVGHVAGETFTIDAKFPEDYGVEDLDGKTAQFEITLNKVQKVVYPALTDEFIQENTDSETVSDYYTFISEKLKASNVSSARAQQKNEAFDVISRNVVIRDYPESEVKKFSQESFNQVFMLAQSYGQDIQTFITQTNGMSMDEFNAYLTESAKSRVEMELIFFAIANNEGITDKLTKFDFDEYLLNVSTDYLSTPEEFLQMNGEEAIWRSLVWDRAMDFVLENGVEISAEDK